MWPSCTRSACRPCLEQACDSKPEQNLVSSAAIPGVELLEAAYNAPPAEPPVPNLGYCCLNMDLREMKPAGKLGSAAQSAPSGILLLEYGDEACEQAGLSSSDCAFQPAVSWHVLGPREPHILSSQC